VKLPQEALARIGLGLVALAVLLAVVLQVRIMLSRSHAELAHQALKDFAQALERHRREHGDLPAPEHAVTIGARRVTLRADAACAVVALPLQSQE
jgi:hypothetical protein